MRFKNPYLGVGKCSFLKRENKAKSIDFYSVCPQEIHNVLGLIFSMQIAVDMQCFIVSRQESDNGIFATL